MLSKLWCNKIKFCCCFLLMISRINAQNYDSAYASLRSELNRVTFHPRTIYFPALCVTLGSNANNEEFPIDNEAIKDRRDEIMPHFKTHIDDYMQYAPILAGYGCLAFGSKQNAWLYTKEVLLNEVIMTASVYSVKHLSKVKSVVNGSHNAFPSGHTAQAFAAATLFNDNFARGKLWLQCISYGSASAVGVLRVLNERHWTSDVVAGVGFGILSAKISEWIVAPHYYKRHLLPVE